MSHGPYSIETVFGNTIDFAAIMRGEAPTFSLADIAWSLAHTYRYGGHLFQPVTVAEHSIAVARRAEELCPGAGRHGFAHDFHEGLGLGDRAGPLGAYLRSRGECGFDAIAAKLDRVIFDRWQIEEHHTIVMQADREAGEWERAHLRPHHAEPEPGPTSLHVFCLSTEQAIKAFRTEAKHWGIT